MPEGSVRGADRGSVEKGITHALREGRLQRCQHGPQGGRRREGTTQEVADAYKGIRQEWAIQIAADWSSGRSHLGIWFVKLLRHDRHYTDTAWMVPLLRLKSRARGPPKDCELWCELDGSWDLPMNLAAQNRYHLDFNACSLRKSCDLNRRTSRPSIAESAAVEFINNPKIAKVSQENRRLDDISE